MTDARFALQWDRPFLLGVSMTHVTLFDGPREPIYVVASGHGAGDAAALLDLWTTLVDGRESSEAIVFVAEEFRSMTGETPSRSGR
jgi:hypothetical protein